MTALRNLSPEDRKRISDAVAAVETRTHAHFSLVVVPASDHYTMFPVAWAALLALAAGGALALGWSDLALRMSFAVQAGVFIAANLLFDWWPVRMMLVPRKYKHARARALAHREFAAHVLGHAHGHNNNGVVFFVSLAERYVEIMAERDLHTLAGEAAWQAMVESFVSAVKQGHIADGFVAGLSTCGDILEAHIPKT